MRPQSVVVYTRPGCHLCDDACDLLAQYGLAVQKVNIDTDPELAARFGLVIPVVEFDGQERFRGLIDEILLRRLLH